MGDGDDEVPGLGEVVELGGEAVHVFEAQAPGGLVQQDGGATRGGIGQQARQAEALQLTFG